MSNDDRYLPNNPVTKYHTMPADVRKYNFDRLIDLYKFWFGLFVQVSFYSFTIAGGLLAWVLKKRRMQSPRPGCSGICAPYSGYHLRGACGILLVVFRSPERAAFICETLGWRICWNLPRVST